jgi:Skp family chaperone for outer membrane proteins
LRGGKIIPVKFLRRISIMSKPKPIEEQIEIARKEKEAKDKKLNELLAKKKEQDEKAAAERLTERGKIVESLISGSEVMTNEQVRTLLSDALAAYNADGQLRL